jgi:hypothetical protein
MIKRILQAIKNFFYPPEEDNEIILCKEEGSFDFSVATMIKITQDPLLEEIDMLTEELEKERSRADQAELFIASQQCSRCRSRMAI